MQSRRQFLKKAAAGFAWSGTLWLPQAQVAVFRRKIPAAATASSCTTLQDSNTGAGDIANAGRNSDETHLGIEFTASASYTVCKIVLSLRKYGTGGGITCRASIWTDTGSTNPSSRTGTESDSVAAADMDTSFADVTFANVSASITNGTRYWVVLRCESLGDSSNCVNWNRDAAGAHSLKEDADGTGSWIFADYCEMGFKLYS